jgi:hypothetical protein
VRGFEGVTACFAPGQTATITVRATDAAGAATEQRFAVTPSTPGAC